MTGAPQSWRDLAASREWNELALLTGWEQMAKAPRATRRSRFVELMRISTGGRYAVLARGRRVVETADSYIGDHDRLLARAGDGDVLDGGSGESQRVSRWTLDGGLDAVVAGPAAVGTELRAKLEEDYATLGLRRRRRWIAVLALLSILAAAAALPVRQWAAAPAIAEGETRVTVAAPIAGRIRAVTDGEVAAGEAVVWFDTEDLVLQARSAEIEVGRLQTALVEAGAGGTENVAVLRAQLDGARVDVARLRADLSAAQVAAPIAGWVDWADELRGQWVNAGDRLGIVRPLEQTLVEARVGVRDWIALEPGADAVFVSDRTVGERIAGVVERVPHAVTVREGESFYAVGVRLERPVAVGEAGTVTVRGTKAPLAAMWFRRPLNAIAARVALAQAPDR